MLYKFSYKFFTRKCLVIHQPFSYLNIKLQINCHQFLNKNKILRYFFSLQMLQRMKQTLIMQMSFKANDRKKNVKTKNLLISKFKDDIL